MKARSRPITRVPPFWKTVELPACVVPSTVMSPAARVITPELVWTTGVPATTARRR